MLCRLRLRGGEKGISTSYLAQLFFDFLHMPDARTFRVGLWLWSTIEVTAILEKTQKD